jgi:hypothetical protein
MKNPLFCSVMANLGPHNRRIHSPVARKLADEMGLDAKTLMYWDFVEAQINRGIRPLGWILTPQEHYIRESGTEHTIFYEHIISSNGRYSSQPYTPVGMIEGILNLLETQRARMLIGKIIVPSDYYGLHGSRIEIALAALDYAGITRHDPRPVENKGYEKIASFPYARR